jgi:hypothetical protein
MVLENTLQAVAHPLFVLFLCPDFADESLSRVWANKIPPGNMPAVL